MDNKKELDESLVKEFERIHEECCCAGGEGGISSFAPEHIMGMSIGHSGYVPTKSKSKSAFGGNIVDDMGGTAGKIIYAKDKKSKK